VSPALILKGEERKSFVGGGGGGVIDVGVQDSGAESLETSLRHLTRRKGGIKVFL